MAGPAPNTKLWTARENEHQPSGLHLIVGGQVEVSNTSKEPRLTESAERNPKQLGLSLTIVDTGQPGVEVMVWKAARFHKMVNANEYETVAIRWDSSAIARVPVIDDTEHENLLDKQSDLQNKKYAAKAAPKKAAAKVKTVGQSAGKPAKKAAKTAGKKAAKKPARKPAAKSVGKTVKKLVGRLVKKLKGKPATKAKNKAKKKAKGGKKGKKP